MSGKSTQNLKQWLWRYLIRPILTFPIRALIWARWNIASAFIKPSARKQNDPRHVLLVVDNDFMARYLFKAAQAIEYPQIKVFFTIPKVINIAAVQQYFEPLPACEYVPYIRSRLRYWDLIIFADHAATSRFAKPLKKIKIQHGIPCGFKHTNQTDYVYGRYVTHRDGSFVYEKFLEPSNWNMKRIHETNPQLAARISVVGDFFVDDMLQKQSHRQLFRDSLGLASTDRVVTIMSNWKPNGLIRTIGKELIEQAANLAQTTDYRFILSTHPNLWSRTGHAGLNYDDLFDYAEKLGLIVIKPHESWDKYLIASDLAVSDFTSLSLQYAVLKKPVIFMNLPDDVYETGSLGDQLYKQSPVLHQPAQLQAVLDSTWEKGITPAIMTMAETIYNAENDTKQNVGREVHAILGVAPAQTV